MSRLTPSPLRRATVRRFALGLAVVGSLALAGSGGVAAAQDTGRSLPAPLAEAAALVAAGDLAGAEARYLEIVAGADPGLVPAALLGLARTRLAAGDLNAARDAADRLVAEQPSSMEAKEGRFVLARVLAAQAPDRETLAAAHAAAEAALAAAGDAPWRDEATVVAARLDVALGAGERAAARLLDLIDREAPTRSRAVATAALVDLLLGRGDWQAAADLIVAALTESSQYPTEAAPSLAALRRRGELIRRLRLRPSRGPIWERAGGVAGLAVKKPGAIAAAEDGSLIVVDNGPDVALWWRDGAVVGRREVPRMGRPYWAAGIAWIPSDDGVVRLESGERRPALAAGVAVRRVEAGAGGPLGPFLLVNKPSRVAEFGPDLRQARSLTGAPAVDPGDLDWTPGAGLHVLDTKAGRVLRFPDSGDPGEAATVISGLDRPKALAVDLLGDLYVLERGGKIRVFAPDGSPLGSLGPALPGGVTLDDPDDLAVDGAGRLYVADPKLSTVIVLE